MGVIPGGGDLERKNQYWIDFGAEQEQKRIIEILEQAFTYKTFELKDYIIKQIKGEN